MVLKVLYFGELLYNIDIVNVIFIVTSTHVNLLKKLSLYHKNTRQLFSLLEKKDEFVAAQMKAQEHFIPEIAAEALNSLDRNWTSAEQQEEMGNVL